MGRLVERTDFGEKLRGGGGRRFDPGPAGRARGCTCTSSANWRRGVREPTWPTVLKLAKALGVSVATFEGEILGDGPKVSHSRGRPRKAVTAPDDGQHATTAGAEMPPPQRKPARCKPPRPRGG